MDISCISYHIYFNIFLTGNYVACILADVSVGINIEFINNTGMGRPLDFEGQANTLPASMGGNKTPIVDELLLHDPSAENWIVTYHKMLLDGTLPDEKLYVPDHLRRSTIKEAAAIQTFPPGYQFCGGKTSVYRQIGNAVPCKLAQCIAECMINIQNEYIL